MVGTGRFSAHPPCPWILTNEKLHDMAGDKNGIRGICNNLVLD